LSLTQVPGLTGFTPLSLPPVPFPQGYLSGVTTLDPGRVHAGATSRNTVARSSQHRNSSASERSASRTSVCARRTRVVESAQCLGLQGDTFVPEKTSTNEYLAILCERAGAAAAWCFMRCLSCRSRRRVLSQRLLDNKDRRVGREPVVPNAECGVRAHARSRHAQPQRAGTRPLLMWRVYKKRAHTVRKRTGPDAIVPGAARVSSAASMSTRPAQLLRGVEKACMLNGSPCARAASLCIGSMSRGHFFPFSREG